MQNRPHALPVSRTPLALALPVGLPRDFPNNLLTAGARPAQQGSVTDGRYPVLVGTKSIYLVDVKRSAVKPMAPSVLSQLHLGAFCQLQSGA